MRVAGWVLGLACGLLGSGAMAQPDGLACLVDASARVKVGAAVTGLMAEVLVDRGDLVQAGQLVARLDSELETAQVALMLAKSQNDAAVLTARNQLDFTTRKVERLRPLIASKAVTEAVYDEARTDMSGAQARLKDAERALEQAGLELRRAEAQLRQREVRSPIDGVVTERLLSGGEYRYEQAPIMTIARIDPLYVETYAPIELIGRVRVGSRAAIEIEAPVGGSYTATVTVVDSVIDAASGTFGVRLSMPNPDRTVSAGLRCRLRFEAAEARSAAEPDIAVKR